MKKKWLSVYIYLLWHENHSVKSSPTALMIIPPSYNLYWFESYGFVLHNNLMLPTQKKQLDSCGAEETPWTKLYKNIKKGLTVMLQETPLCLCQASLKASTSFKFNMAGLCEDAAISFIGCCSCSQRYSENMFSCFQLWKWALQELCNQIRCERQLVQPNKSLANLKL